SSALGLLSPCLLRRPRCTLLPYTTLFRSKKTPAILGLFAIVVLVGLWFERYMLVYPSLYQGVERVVFGWQELVTALPFAGLLIASIMWFATRFPILQLWLNPRSEEHTAAL